MVTTLPNLIIDFLWGAEGHILNVKLSPSRLIEDKPNLSTEVDGDAYFILFFQ